MSKPPDGGGAGNPPTAAERAQIERLRAENPDLVEKGRNRAKESARLAEEVRARHPELRSPE